MNYKNLTREQIKDSGKPPVYGLSFIPTIEPEISDFISDIRNTNLWKSGKDDNSEEVLSLISKYARGDVMEIGVSLYTPGKSFTNIIIDNKKDSDIYFGIDVENRSSIQSLKPNVNFYQTDSLKRENVLDRVKRIGVKQFDVLIIDGHHSVFHCINDIQYSELVKVGGLVIIHDTNAFPGPICLMESMDRTMFEISEPLLNKKDFGLAICKKLK